MKKPYVIGLCGGSGSGKTSFISAIRKRFTESEVCIISFDDFYLPIEEQLIDNGGVENFDLPNSFDTDSFTKNLNALLKGQQISKEEYIFNNPEAKPEIKIFKPAPIIVIEGLFIYHNFDIRSMIDLKLFIDTKLEYKIIRRIKRDRVERNYPLDDVLYRYEHHVSPAYEKYIAPYKDLADLIINNNKNFDLGLEVISSHIIDRLKNY